MNKAQLLAFGLVGLLSTAPGVFAADAVDSSGPRPEDTGPTNPTPPTLPTPGTGIDNGTGTGVDGPDDAPTPGTDGTGIEDRKAPASPKPSSGSAPKGSQSPPGS